MRIAAWFAGNRPTKETDGQEKSQTLHKRHHAAPDCPSRYAAPEFFQGKTSNQSDQYSLAASYCHLRGGRLPFAGNPGEVMAGHLQRQPDLTMLPERERPVVARALAKEAKDRWPSCRAFVAALQGPLEVAAAQQSMTNEAATSKGRCLTRMAMALGLVAVVAGLGLWSMMVGQDQPEEQGPLVPIRDVPVSHGVPMESATKPSEAKPKAKPAADDSRPIMFQKTFRVGAKTYIGDNGLNPEANTRVRVEKGQELLFRVGGTWSVNPRKGTAGAELLIICIGEDNKSPLWAQPGATQLRVIAPHSGWLFLGNSDPFTKDNRGDLGVRVTIKSTGG